MRNARIPILVLLTALIAGCGSGGAVSPPSETASIVVTPTAIQPTPTPTPTPEIPLAAAQVPAVPTVQPHQPASSYYVQPILFVPNDLTPDLDALATIERTSQGIQRWYAEQLRGVTFTLEPALLVVGSHEQTYYYGACYPPLMACDWGYKLWDSITRDLSVLGYLGRSDRILSVSFQDEGMGGTALGGNNVSLGGIGMLTSADLLSYGGGAHEIGHALELPHTSEVNGEPGISLMGWGFYGFPQTTFVNSETNPERDHLLASRFMNVRVPLTDGGFEDCVASWTIEGAKRSCVTDGGQFSGLSALEVRPLEDADATLRQVIVLQPGVWYDVTGWARLLRGKISIAMQAFDSGEQLISEEQVAVRTAFSNNWEKIGGVYRAPENAARFQIVLSVERGSLGAVLDDFAVQASSAPPVHPVPLTNNSGETVSGAQPFLRWSDIPCAPVYQLQIAADDQFTTPVLDRYLSSPFFQVDEGVLEVGRTYTWRVRAGNAVGWGEWSPAWQLALRPESEYTGDEFPDGERLMDAGWQWIRQDPSTWGFNGYPSTPQNGYLSIDIRGGDLAGPVNTATNLLVRDAPDGDWAADILANIWGLLSAVGQEAGLMVYRDDDNYCKMGKIVNESGFRLQWACELDGQLTVYDHAWEEGFMPTRIRKDGDSYTAWYSVNGIEWRQLGEAVQLDWEDAKIGLYAFGPIGELEPSAAHFDYFRYAYP